MPEPRRILYLDPFAGISGDMFVGALLDLGLDFAKLTHEVSKLGLGGYHLSSKRVFRGAMSALKFDVEIDGELQKEYDADAVGDNDAQGAHGHDHGGHGHSHAADNDADVKAAGGISGPKTRRNFRDIKALILRSSLSERVKRDSVAAFQKLAEAEGRIHNMPPEEVGFHEVGALDSIVDFVAVCAGLELLEVDEVWCGPLALGRGGFVKCDHGLMPVPAPATLELVKGMTLRDTPVEKELTTPTGAALVAALANRFCSAPALRIEKIGYGAGSREKQAVPNVLRAILGTAEAARDGSNSRDEVVEIRVNIDDATPETLGYLSGLLFERGALDVFYTPILMKKNRPASMLTVLVPPELLEALASEIFTSSSTFGLRYETLQRLKLEREFIQVETRFGKIGVKIGRWDGRVVAVHPEFEDCRKLAQAHQVSLQEVVLEVQIATKNKSASV